MSNRTIILVSMAALALSACSAKVDSSNPGIPDITGTNQLIGNSPSAPVANTALEGKWTLSCHALSAQAYAAGEVNFHGNAFSNTLSLYSDSGCKTAMGPAQTTNGTFSIPASGQIDMSNGDGSTQYNVYEISNGVLYTGLQPGTSASNRPSSVDQDLPFVYAGAPTISTAPQAPSNPSGPVSPPASCPNLTGNYQMNTDLFSLAQTACNHLTWNTQGQPWLGTSDSTTEYSADGVEVLVPSDDQTLQDFQRSYFKTDSFVIEDRLVQSGATTKETRIYTLTSTPCNLMNPDGGTYLMAQVYINGTLENDRCQFWSKH